MVMVHYFFRVHGIITRTSKQNYTEYDILCSLERYIIDNAYDSKVHASYPVNYIIHSSYISGVPAEVMVLIQTVQQFHVLA